MERDDVPGLSKRVASDVNGLLNAELQADEIDRGRYYASLDVSFEDDDFADEF